MRYAATISEKYTIRDLYLLNEGIQASPCH